MARTRAATYTIDELRHLYLKAEVYNIGFEWPELKQCKWLYKDMPYPWWNIIIKRNNSGVIPVEVKDAGGDPRCPINHKLPGIMFCVNVLNNGLLPQESSLGDTRWKLDMLTVFNEMASLGDDLVTDSHVSDQEMELPNKPSNTKKDQLCNCACSSSTVKQTCVGVAKALANNEQLLICNRPTARLVTNGNQDKPTAKLVTNGNQDRPTTRPINNRKQDMICSFDMATVAAYQLKAASTNKSRSRTRNNINKHAPHLYFADFYCNFPRSPHYVTLVMTKHGSGADEFCKKNLPEIDFRNNPFFCYCDTETGPVFYVSAIGKKTWVEVFYTEDLCLDLGEFDVKYFRKSSTVPPSGISKKPDCPVCNLQV